MGRDPVPSRLIILSPCGNGSGLARVCRQLILAGSSRFDTHVLSLGHDVDPEARRSPATFHRVERTPSDPHGVSSVCSLVGALRPRVVVVVHGPAHQELYLAALSALPRTFGIVAYLMLDGEPIGLDLAPHLAPGDACVCYTRWASTLCRACIDGEVEVIGHGVDTGVFRPLAGSAAERKERAFRADVRRRVFPDAGLTGDEHIILNANQLTFRKRIDVTLDAFAQVARRRSDAYLCLHHAGMSREARRALVRSVHAMGLGGRVLLSPERDDHVLDDEQLNLLYNACDVGLSTSMGEGWGLVAFEHAATGAPQVLPAHSACRDLWQGAAELISLHERVAWDRQGMWTVSPSDVAQVLLRVLSSEVIFDECASRCLALARSEEYSWTTFRTKWSELLSRMA